MTWGWEEDTAIAKIIIIIIIIIIMIYSLVFFTPALADGLSLKFEWQ